MRESDLSFKIAYPLWDVWNGITNFQDYSWRSDLSDVEVGENFYVELHNSGNRTTYTVSEVREGEYYQLTIEHEQFTGTRSYTFSALSEAETEVRIVDRIELKDTITELFSFLSMNLKMGQKLFIRDLNRKLGE